MEPIQTIEQMHRETLLKAIIRARSIQEMSTLMGISTRTITRWFRRWGISYDWDLKQYVIIDKNKNICPVQSLTAIAPPDTKPPAKI